MTGKSHFKLKKNHKLGEITRKRRRLNDRRLSILSLKRNYSLFWMFILKQNFCDFRPCSMSMLMVTDVPPSKTEASLAALLSNKFNYDCKYDNGATFPSFNWICTWQKQPSFFHHMGNSGARCCLVPLLWISQLLIICTGTSHVVDQSWLFYNPIQFSLNLIGSWTASPHCHLV